jgi:probable F420-dependent oxidoreductase
VRVRPFRFGVSLRTARSRAEWREKARRAEALGFSTVLVPDHLTDLPAPFPALVAAAEATSTVRVGTFVLNNDLRHPALVSREAAAVDLLSDGRLELGLGAGHMASEYREVGMRYDAAATRVERLEEAVAIVTRLLAGEEVTFAGAHYALEGHRVGVPPVQRPRPPLLVGGNGRRLLTLAARAADIVGLVGFSHRASGTDLDLDFGSFGFAGAAERVALVREAAGERFATLELNALLQAVVVTDSPADAARAWIGSDALPVEAALDSPFTLFGSHAGMADALRETRERLGISYFACFEPALEAIAPVVAQLAGT